MVALLRLVTRKNNRRAAQLKELQIIGAWHSNLTVGIFRAAPTLPTSHRGGGAAFGGAPDSALSGVSRRNVFAVS
jgi:hypothetical protein